MKPQTIHLAFAFDENYVTPFYVLLTSIFANHEGCNFAIHAIAPDVKPATKKEISMFAQQHKSEMFYYEVNEADLKGLVIPEKTWFTIAAYYRLFFAQLLPITIDKFLYIDTDTVVVASLVELYNTNLGSKPLGAAQEVLRKSREDLGISDINNHFNSGVLLINAPEWRAQKITERAIQFVLDFPEAIQCVDQDALNAILINNWYKLDKKYNVLFQDVPIDLPAKGYNEFLKDKVIIHYTLGTHKPWRSLCANKFRYLYHEYKKQSPRALEKKYTDFQVKPFTIYKFCKIRTRETLLNHPRSFFAIKKVAATLLFFIEF